MSETLREKRVRAGRKGGNTTFARYGSAYMAEIGRMGFEAQDRKYNRVVVGLSRYGLVDRRTGKLVAIW